MKSKESDESKIALKKLKSWIMSWFNYVETEEEYQLSLHKFKLYFESIQSILGDASTDELTKLVSNNTC